MRQIGIIRQAFAKVKTFVFFLEDLRLEALAFFGGIFSVALTSETRKVTKQTIVNGLKIYTRA